MLFKCMLDVCFVKNVCKNIYFVDGVKESVIICDSIPFSHWGE